LYTKSLSSFSNLTGSIHCSFPVFQLSQSLYNNSNDLHSFFLNGDVILYFCLKQISIILTWFVKVFVLCKFDRLYDNQHYLILKEEILTDKKNIYIFFLRKD